MKLNEILVEGPSTVVPYTWTTQTDTKFEARFEIDGNQYGANGFYDNLWFIKDVKLAGWEIGFFMVDSKYNGPNADMTGTGNQWAVLGTAQAIYQEFFQQHPAQCIFMSGAIPSRVKVYTRMLQRILPENWQTSLVNNKYIVAYDPTYYAQQAQDTEQAA